MDSRPVTVESKHTYPPRIFTRSTSSPAVPKLSSTTQAAASPTLDPAPGVQYYSHVGLWPVLLPQQSSLFQAQLLQYNKLIAPGRGGGLQTPPLPPLLSAQTAHAGTRSRSASKTSKQEQRTRQGSQSCHGNRGTPATPSNGDRASVANKDTNQTITKMVPPKKIELAQPLPPRPFKHSTSPAAVAPHSSSVPSTPRQRARNFSFESREQSPSANHNHSPRSVYSEANGTVPSLRPLPPPRPVPCKYETGLKFSRRRIPYNIGDALLDKVDLKNVKAKLAHEEQEKLTTNMRELYNQLQPTASVEQKRHKLIGKLEKLFNDTWPGHDIRVHLFGSSGNLLCSDDSDVDICIVTRWKELESVCKIADLLAKNGMEKVVCVNSAKVPIVKIWDPELQLACDMNVNNTLALENTRMIRTYVEIDDRIRPLAMIVKHWTRRRIINDAAFGGTLSSYTWICMIIAFLQLRQPPVVPALHQRQHQMLPKKDGEMAAFADDLDQLRGFGDKNKSTLGELLFQFFRFFAHEFDYANNVLSIRLGKTVSKRDKNWHLGMLNNRLCVEEPFNNERNLGNTVDDTAFRGLHLELRRAFDLIAQGKLEECCEQFEYPKEEEKIFQKPASTSRPVLLRSASQQQTHRQGRGGSRTNGRQQPPYRNGGGAHAGSSNNNSSSNSANNNASRRASSSVAYEGNANAMFLAAGYPMAMGMSDGSMYMQQPSPEVLAHTLSQLQLQENNLRFLQYTQSQAFAQQQAMAHAQRMQSSSTGQASSGRSRTNSFDTPMTAPMRSDVRPEMYYYPLHFQAAQAFYAQHGYVYPQSPTPNQSADPRRASHRSSAANDAATSASGSTLRSQSQPASRPVNGISAAQNLQVPLRGSPGMSGDSTTLMNGLSSPALGPDEAPDTAPYVNPSSNSPVERSRLAAQKGSLEPGPLLTGTLRSLAGLGDDASRGSPVGRRRPSADQFPQVVLDRINRSSRSPSPFDPSRSRPVSHGPSQVTSSPSGQSHSQSHSTPKRDPAPLVVNGSLSMPPSNGIARGPSAGATSPTESATAYDNPLHMVQRSDTSGSIVNTPSSQSSMSGYSPTPDRPIVVNGTTPTMSYTPNQSAYPSYDAMSNNNNTVQWIQGTYGNGHTGLANNNFAQWQHFPPRGPPNPLIAHLDLATQDSAQAGEMQHLSPVYEMNSPSPTLARMAEVSSAQAMSRPPVIAHNRPDTKPDHAKGKQKSTVERSDGSQAANPRVNGLARENGHARGTKNDNDNAGNGWQKISKSKKKAADGKVKGETHSQREELPKDESERKGG
ncbi:poly(A) RNA polymerase GLD2 [Microdochium nivale]|nr:poly(A) RNA polymerase GLD2 [Microdochium nivale]